MIRVESYASDESLLWFTFNREQEEDESDRASAIELVVAFSTFFADWISPLTASVRVESCDPNHYYFEDSKHPPPNETWFLRRRDLDERLYAPHSRINSLERFVERVGASELLGVVEEALSQPPPLETLEVALAEVLVEAAEISLPDGIELILNNGHSEVEPILVRDGRRWLAQGPDQNFYGPPVTMRAHNIHGATKFTIEFCWDFWLKHPDGLTQVRAAVERVLARGHGWQITAGNLPPQAAS